MNDVGIRRAHVTAAADALRSAGFAEAVSVPTTGVLALTKVSSHAAVLVRIVPQHAAQHAFVALICATCRRHRACGWRAHLSADVPALVVAACAQAALSAPMPCQTNIPHPIHGEEKPSP